MMAQEATSTPWQTFIHHQANWLSQFETNDLLSRFLTLCQASAFYIVDAQQQVLYWSPALAELTALSEHDMLHQTCSDDFKILDHTALVQSMSTINQVSIDIKKLSLYSKDHHFAGGMGMVIRSQEIPERPNVPKIPILSDQAFQGIISRSPAMQDVFQIIKNAAETEATVLVRGESGSGKELVAKAIHHLSARKNQPFLAINCAALSSNLLESELFGHVRGAFTGAIKDHHGLFRRAHGGTLFLDEVAELPLELQAKLLRVIQERNYIPVGGDKTVQVDVRIVAATHRSLREEVKLGHFREDLMYRLRVVPIFIPPLRERREDINLLIWHFISQHNAANFRRIDKIEPQAMRLLLDYPWPGNIRELHNVVEYAFAVGRGSTLRVQELPPEFRETKTPWVAPTPTLNPEINQEDEKSAMQRALLQNKGNINAAAKQLGMSRATFWRKRKQHDLQYTGSKFSERHYSEMD